MDTDKELLKRINQLTRASPFFDKFNAQRYRNLKGYIEHETVMFQLARLRLCYQSFAPQYLEKDFTHKVSLIVLEKAYQHGFQNYWLSEKLFDAFNRTEVPDKGVTIKRAVPAGVLLLPPKLRNPDGQLLKWILFYHKLAGETIPSIELDKGRVDILTLPEENISWFTILEDSTQYAISRKVNDEKFPQKTDEFYINELIEAAGRCIDTKTETEFTDKVTSILLQTLLYLQLAPEQPGDYLKATATHKQKLGKNHRFEPHVIGKEYQLKTERAAIASVIGDDSRMIATHWRRGYYRWQPYGSREKPQHKLIWIEPVLVNPPA